MSAQAPASCLDLKHGRFIGGFLLRSIFAAQAGAKQVYAVEARPFGA